MDLKILFAFYPLFVSYNHGIALLSSTMKQHGWETNLYLLDDVNRFHSYLVENKFDAICFSCVTVHDYKLSLPFIFEALALGQNVRLGGVYARWKNLSIPGVAVCSTELIEYDSLNDLPLPDYALFKNIPFDREYPWLKNNEKVIPYHTSRGCIHKCSFCMAPFQGTKFDVRRKVEKDLRAITSTYNPDVIVICDETTPYFDKGWRESWGDFRFPFMCYIRADITEDQLLWLIDRGLTACMFGVESGNEKYRNEILNKHLFDKDICRTINTLKNNNISYAPFYMTDTPMETMTIKKQTYDMSRDLGGYPVTFQYEDIFEGGKKWEQR